MRALLGALALAMLLDEVLNTVESQKSIDWTKTDSDRSQIAVACCNPDILAHGQRQKASVFVCKPPCSDPWPDGAINTSTPIMLSEFGSTSAPEIHSTLAGSSALASVVDLSSHLSHSPLSSTTSSPSPALSRLSPTMATSYFQGDLVVHNPPPPPHIPALATPASPFHAYPPPSPVETSPKASLSPSLSTDQPQAAIPKVGQTRCCECLVSVHAHCDRSSIAFDRAISPLCCSAPLYRWGSYPPFVDWALLSADLQFIYLDPVLAAHLEDQAENLVGQSLLTFVHPDERETARQDLWSVLDSKTLHGSVTR